MIVVVIETNPVCTRRAEYLNVEVFETPLPGQSKNITGDFQWHTVAGAFEQLAVDIGGHPMDYPD